MNFINRWVYVSNLTFMPVFCVLYNRLLHCDEEWGSHRFEAAGGRLAFMWDDFRSAI